MNSAIRTPLRRGIDYLLRTGRDALIYAALGWAGLSLAIPPGYASPLFPAAGFAAALMLLSGLRAWAGIFLGSLVLNAFAGGGVSSLSSLVVPALIAAGATAQAWVAAMLVMRLTGDGWRSMEVAGETVRSLLAAGPAASLVSASVGVTTLLATGVVARGDYLYTWWTWWAGDALGVMIALPLCLAIYLRRRSVWQARLLALGLPMILTLLVIGAGYVGVAYWERNQIDSLIRNHGDQIAKRLTTRFIAHQEALSALTRLIEVTPGMSFDQFERFTRITLRDNPDIFALSFNPYVTREERAQFERRMARANDMADYRIVERDAQKRLVTAPDRPDYVAVGYIAPLAGNMPARGFDINSEPVRRAAIAKAREAHQPSITAPIRLVQEKQTRTGALLLHPAYAADGGSLRGFAVGVIKLDQMVQIATADVELQGLAFQITDVAAGKEGAVYASDAKATPESRGPVWKTRVQVADRQWELSVFATAGYSSQNRPWIAWAAAAVSLVLATLLQILLLTTTGNAAISERTVSRQSQVLEAQSSTIRERTAQIDAIFELSPDGFVAISHEGRVRLVNPAFHEMTGIAAEEVLDRPVAVLDALLRQRAEQPELFAGIGAMFLAERDISDKQVLTLARPRHVVLQLVGVQTHAETVDRFLYLRDVTHEAEVDRIKSEFLSHAAHELRTPMASIYGFTELLLNMDLDEATRRDLLETIYRQTAWLVDIINELLDLARIESRRGRDFKIADVPLAAMVREVISDLGIDSERWPISLELPEQDLTVRADAAKVRQSVGNVVANAVKYSPDGGAIQIMLREKPGYVGIAVADHGIGMTPEQAKRVGERFWRADTSGKTPGTGLGMAIVCEILQLHGGNLEVDSRLGRGSVFTLWLPAAGESVTFWDEEPAAPMREAA